LLLVDEQSAHVWHHDDALATLPQVIGALMAGLDLQVSAC
jgi:hypothetical protein